MLECQHQPDDSSYNVEQVTDNIDRHVEQVAEYLKHDTTVFVCVQAATSVTTAAYADKARLIIVSLENAGLDINFINVLCPEFFFV